MNQLQSTCPVCEGSVSIPSDTEESEIISCSECDTRLVVASKTGHSLILNEAPAIEEDWGQ